MEGVRKIKGRCFRKVLIYFLTYCMALNTSLPGALAEVVLQPDGIKNGSIIVTPLGGGTTQNMTASDGAIGHFSDFDVAAGHVVTCVQPSANANALFRVFSGDGTQILGQLDATGNIYLIDPAGILFGVKSQINVHRLIASSLDMSNQDFLNGRYEFFAGADNIGTIINNGTINAAEGVALIGKKIINTNMITTNPSGFVVMAAGDRVLLGNTGSKIVVEMDSVTLTDPENPDGFGDVVNDNTGGIAAPSGTIVLAAGDFFSMALDPNPVRIEGGIGRVVQNGNINADGINGDGGRITLTAGDEVVFGSDSLTTANGGISNAGANGGEVITYASALYSDDAVVDFRAGAEIEVKGGFPADPTMVDVEAATFEGGLAELSGDHLFFEGTVDATSEPFNVPDPLNAGETLTITPTGGTLHIDPVSLTLADGGIPAEGAAIDTFYEKVLETYSQTGINTILEADYDITIENISDGVIAGGSGDIVLRTAYNKGGIEFKPETDGDPITTTVQTIGVGNIFMLAGSGGIKTGHLQTYEDSANPGRIRIFTNNGGGIEMQSLTVDGGNDVEVSVIASGDLAINGNVITNTNKVPANYDKTGRAYICLVSDNGSVNILGAVEVEAHGKDQTIAQIHICADNTVSVHTGNGRIQAIAKTSSTGTADADVKIHAGSEEPEAITVIRSSGGNPIRIQANTSGATIGPLDFTGAETEYEQTNGGTHVFVQIADAWLEVCPDCPTPPDLPPPIELPKRAPIAVDDDYSVGKGDVILIILSEDGVLVNGEDGNGEDYDPDDDVIIAILLGGGTTAQNGTVFLQEDGGFEYTPPAEKIYDDGYSSDAEGDYALFIDTFIYYVQDEGDLTSNEATVTITSKNYIPVAQPDSYEVVHNVNLSPTVDQGIITGVVPAVNGDTDVDGDLLTPYLPGDVTTGSTALGGTVTLNSSGSFSYDPPVDTVGTDSFTYYATDGYNNSKSVEVTIDLTNTQPVAQPDSYDVVHNVNLTPAVDQGITTGVVPAINGDYDDDGDSLTPFLPGDVTTGATDQGGQVTLNADGSFSYDPPADWVGVDSFTYYVTDGYSNSEPVQVTIEVTNTSPVAQPDSYGVGHNITLSPEADQGIIVGVMPADNGDYDPDEGDSLTPFLSGGLTTGPTAQGGQVTLNEDGSFTYEPPSNYVGSDNFTYYVSDDYGGVSEEVQVSIEVGNTSPVAQPDSYDVLHNVTLLLQADQGIITGVVPAINGDYDDDGDSLTPFLPGDVTTGATDQGGQVTLNADGSFSYDPPADWVGIDSFTYYVNDGYENSESVQVTIEVTNTLPIAQPDSYQVVYGKPLSPTVDQGIITGVVPGENGDYDLDPNDSLTPYLPGALTTGPTDLGGTVKLNSDGSFTYTPPIGFSGTDSFTYYVTDGYGNSESVQVTMHVDSPPPAVPYIQPVPGLQREMIEISGCPALIKWVASELGTDEKKIQIRMANSLASPRDIQPCDACAKLKDAATFLQDLDGTRVAALTQVINGFASSTAPPTEEQMALIADAIANNIEGNREYAAAGEYLDALAKYVGILNSEMGYSADESIQFAIDNYVGQLVEGEEMGVAAFVVARLVALRRSL